MLFCLGMIRICPSVPESYIKEELELVNKYRPIEVDPYMPREEKIKHMVNWWKSSEELLKYSIKPDYIILCNQGYK